MADTASRAETAADFEDEGKRWEAELEAALKPEEDFRKIAKRIEERYRDEEQLTTKRKTRRFNILWSNTEILKAALYAQDPKQIIERRYRDDDPVGRTAAQVLDRAIGFHIDQTGFRDTMKAAVLDAVLIGRGVARVRYMPEYGPPVMDPMTGQPAVDEMDKPVPSVVYEEATPEYVHWEDFITSATKSWEHVRWVAFRARMTRDQLRERFGKDIANQVNLEDFHDDKGEKANKEDKHQIFKRASIYEIWNKPNKTVYFFAKTAKQSRILETAPDPLRLNGFFPCPKPLTFCGTNSDIIPRAEYEMYKDQAEEIDTLTHRINLLIKAVRVAGIYNSANKELVGFLEAVDNSMTGIDNWQAFQEKGGFKGAVDFLPLEPMVNSIQVLAEARERIKQELYEVTGIGDIIRGASDPDETATAQRIKGRFAGLRLQDKQDRVAIFARDLLEIMTEVIAEHFQVETLKLMTGLQLPDLPQPVMQPPMMVA